MTDLKNWREENIKHGMARKGARTRLYRTWTNMRYRCAHWPRYAGRGIRVEWPDFASFKRDMESSYLKHVAEHGEANTTIGRIDNDGNYSLLNCRWATIEEQQFNRRNNRFETIDGVTRRAIEWAKMFGISHKTFTGRLRQGIPPKRALVQPVKVGRYAKITDEEAEKLFDAKYSSLRKTLGIQEP
jgi:hypothetical protein